LPESIDPAIPCDPRGAIAVARVNYLHGKYTIKNEDYLYNLALFVLEPVRWTARYDWRPHSPLERQAFFVFWMEIGRRMGMQNIWETFEDMEEWALAYEEQHMVPSNASEQLAKRTIAHYLTRLPNVPGLRRFFEQLVLCFLDERTRRAMRLGEPSLNISRFISAIFAIRAFVVRHMCLPRRTPSLWVQLDTPPASCPASRGADKTRLRMHAVYKRKTGPWYYPESTGLTRVIQQALVNLGLQDPQKLPGKQWKSDGYRLEEMGPVQFEHEGHEQVMEEAAKIQGRPVTGPWSLS